MNIRHYGMAIVMAVQWQWAAAGAWAQAGTLRLTVGEAWQMAQAGNMSLRLGSKEVDAAAARLSQERLPDNPEVSVQHNVNNPVTHRYFDVGRDGETDVQVSQRIYVGGQRGERVRKARAELRRAEFERADAARLLRRDLCVSMATLASLRQKAVVVARELDSMARLMNAYAAQADKGNVARAELLRIQGQHLLLLKESTELGLDIGEEQRRLRLLIGGRAESADSLLPVIDYAATTAALDTIGKDGVRAVLALRPDMQAGAQAVAAAGHEVALQRANALPEVSLTGEWDKNGNIGRNFFAVGVTLTVPLLNRNQGARKAAAAQLDASRLRQEIDRRQALADIDRGWERLTACRDIERKAAASAGGDAGQLMEQAEQQYVRRNISLIQLLDYYQAFRDSRFMLIESRRDVLLAMAALDMEIK